MIVLQCTQELAAHLKPSSHDGVTRDVPLPLESWAVHCIKQARRYCLIFSHLPTGYAFFIQALRKNELKDMVVVFRRGLIRAMQHTGFEEAMVYRLMDFVGTMRVGSLKDEALIRRMKDLEWHYRTLSEGYWTCEAEPYPLHIIHDELNSRQKRNHQPWDAADCPTRQFGKLIEKAAQRSEPARPGHMTNYMVRLN